MVTRSGPSQTLRTKPGLDDPLLDADQEALSKLCIVYNLALRSARLLMQPSTI